MPRDLPPPAERRRHKNDTDKDIMKQALKEWFKELFSSTEQKVGRWVIRIVIGAIFYAVMQMIINISPTRMEKIIFHAVMAE